MVAGPGAEQARRHDISTVLHPVRPTSRPSDPQLRRSGTEKMLGGVCGGLAEYSGIDVVLWRVGFVGLTLAGGAGVVVYLLLWVLMPSGPLRPGDSPSADRPPRRQAPRRGLRRRDDAPRRLTADGRAPRPQRGRGAVAQVVCCGLGSSRASSWISFSALGTPSFSSLVRSISASSSMPNSSARLISQNQMRKTMTPASAP